jgi:4-amino-4-deoxy-L-arabinose transferase-like glycosyltransferase
MKTANSSGPFDIGERADALLGWLTVSNRRAAIALLVVTFVCFLPGFASLPVTNRDESRFAQPSKQMIETGDYIDIRLQEQSRYRKPIGIYWLQSGTTRAAEVLGFENARHRIEFYRLPSLIAAIGAVLLCFWTALAFVSRRYAFLAGSALASSVLLGFEARIATIDASLLLTAVAAQGALMHAYLSRDLTSARSWKLAAIFWTAIAGSVLLKGPIVPAVVILTAVSLSIADRSASWFLRLPPAAGVLWALLLASPWFIAMSLRSDFMQQSVGTDLMGRLLNAAEGHWGPPGYFWLLSWFTFWPAIALAPMATAFAWANRREPKLRALIAWIVPGWLMFEIVVTKLPHYVLPIYPAIAILIALAIERREPADGWSKGTAALWPIFAIALCVGVAILALMFDGRFGRAYLPFAVIAIVAASFAWWNVIIDRVERGFVLAIVGGIATSFAFYTVLPRIQGFSIAPRLVAAAKSAPCSSPELASAGYHEPNLVFLGGTETRLVLGAGAAEFLHQGGCRVAIIERSEQRAFADRAAVIGLVTARIAEVEGFDYSNWRRASFLVLMPKDGR